MGSSMKLCTYIEADNVCAGGQGSPISVQCRDVVLTSISLKPAHPVNNSTVQDALHAHVDDLHAALQAQIMFQATLRTKLLGGSRSE